MIPPEFREASVNCLNTLLMTMRGTTYVYQGDELGMTNIDLDDIEDYRDLQAIAQYRTALERGDDMEAHMARLKRFGRDHSRTPMQWTGGPQAGFTTGQPWLRVNPNYLEINVAEQEGRMDSCLNNFRRLTALRRQHPVLVYGDYTPVMPEDPAVFAYVREMGEERMLVAMNWSAGEVMVELPEGFGGGEVLFGNPKSDNDPLTLQAWQSIILTLI